MRRLQYPHSYELPRYAGRGLVVQEKSTQVQGVYLVQTIALHEAEGRLAEIIEKLSPGEEIMVTRDNKPVATIRATPACREPPRFGTLRGSILYIAPDFDAIPEGFEDYLP
jgi:antitoxin (DNA-binding transcriptional repressor) of toxin-antitoxin stability system